ncbi:MAG: response regulator [Verrucomicrobiota bacterium]
MSLTAPPSAVGAPGVIRVALVEDFADYREYLQVVLGAEPALDVVAVCQNCAEARLPESRPDVVLLDLVLPDGSGIDVLARVQPRLPHARFVVLTTFEEMSLIRKAFRRGASGYLLKRAGAQEILLAVRRAASGGSPLSDPVSAKVLSLLRDDPPGAMSVPGLGPQENRLLQEVCLQGKQLKEAATVLGVTFNTARTYLQRIYRKLGVRTRWEAERRFRELAGPDDPARPDPSSARSRPASKKKSG